ncbi:MAG: MFS transporter [bacterium]|nr:MFS transporter [bacterium]
MATALLIVIYIAFIGLGIPDSLFGAAWPAIYNEFDLPVSYANFITIFLTGCTFVSSLLSPRLINKFGTDVITFVSTAATAIALFGISLSGNFLFLILFSIPLGIGAGAIDSALNNYVALHYSAMHMNFLHCFYGVGISFSPYLLSFALSQGLGWRGGYRWISVIQICITVLMFLSFPLWKKVRHKNFENSDHEKPITLSINKLLKIKGLPTILLMFFCACSIEFCCGVWGSTFLVEHRGVQIDTAARILTFYYIGIALGRFLSGIVSVKISSERLIWIGESLFVPAIILLLIPGSASLSAVGLFLAGCGISPIYPNLMHLTPKFFGRSFSQSVMGIQTAISYIGMMLSLPLFGILAQHISVGLYPYYMLAIFLILLIATIKSKVKATKN